MNRLGHFITDITTEHTGGNCMADVLRLRNGAIVVITDEMIGVYDLASDWDGSEGEDSVCVEGVRPVMDDSFERNEAGGIGAFIRDVMVDEPFGPVTTDVLTLHDGRVIGIDCDSLVVYPAGAMADPIGRGMNFCPCAVEPLASVDLLTMAGV